MVDNLTSNATPTPTPVPTTPSPAPTPTPVTATPVHHDHKHWALILVLMGLCLAAAMYLVYKKSINDYLVKTPTTMVQEKKMVAPTTTESTETSGSVEQDQTMPTNEVTDDVLKEIDDVQNTDASASFDDSQVSDLE